jgi:hypothetical protein
MVETLRDAIGPSLELRARPLEANALEQGARERVEARY